MARTRVRWNQTPVERRAFNLVRRNARRAGAEVRDEIRAQISSPAQGNRGAGPGQPPRLRSGNLRRYVRSAVRARSSDKQIFVKVGALARAAFYGLFLERGTKNLAARPFIRTSRTNSVIKRAMGILVGKR